MNLDQTSQEISIVFLELTHKQVDSKYQWVHEDSRFVFLFLFNYTRLLIYAYSLV